MLECAISECSSRVKFLRSGTLHLIDVQKDGGNSAKRMIWLCPQCTANYVVQTWRAPGEQLRLRQRPGSLPIVDLLAEFAGEGTQRSNHRPEMRPLAVLVQ